MGDAVSETQVLSLILFIVGIACYAGMTIHYIGLRDGAAKIGLLGLALAILLGQIGNLALLLARYCWPAAMDALRVWMLLPEIVTVAAGVWLLSVAILQGRRGRRG